MSAGIIRNRVTQSIPKFTYDGSYEFINDGNGNWRIKLKSNGTLTFTSLGNARKGIDVFLVGGGAGGVAWVSTMVATAGGGAGYTLTDKTGNIKPEKGGNGYSISIGAGGAGKEVHGEGGGSATGNNGKNTLAFGYTASGGKGGQAGYNADPYTEINNYAWAQGGNGGSGGAPDVGSHATGGTNGGNSQAPWSHETSGKGQKSVTGPNGETGNTYEFGEEVSGNTRYADGGGYSTEAKANTGNGGKQGNNAGSSGIVVIRNHR